MKLMEKIAAAIPRQEDAEIELFGQKFPVKVLICSMADYNRRMECFKGDAKAIAAEMAGWFFDEDGEPAFAPDDFDQLPATTIKDLVALFARVNVGTDTKNV